MASQVVLVVKNTPANAGDTRGMGLTPGLGRFLWSRKWQPTPGFLPGESHGQRSLVGYSPWGQRVGHDRGIEHTHSHIYMYVNISPLPPEPSSFFPSL